MALQVIKDNEPLANVAIKSLSGGIQALANSKMNTLRQQQEVKGLQSLYGLSAQEAEYIATRPPEIQQKILEPYASGLSRIKAEQQEGAPGQETPGQEGAGTFEETYSPENLQKALQHLQTPEAQQEFSPEQIQQAQQKIQELIQNPQLVAQRGQQLQAQQQQAQPQQERPAFAQAYGRGLQPSATPEQKQQQTDYKRTLKYVDDLDKEEKLDGQVLKKVKAAKETFDRVKGKIPQGSGRFIPAKLRTDADYRTYDRELKAIVSQMIESSKGRMTDARKKLIEEAKAAIDQPIETQEAALNAMIEEFSQSEKKRALVSKIKQENNGKYPSDLSDAVFQRQQEQEQILSNPGAYPQMFSEGTTWDDNGTIRKVVNGQWNPPVNQG